eukprot:6198533-Pleurochrysis_carterae.AAC.3
MEGAHCEKGGVGVGESARELYGFCGGIDGGTVQLRRNSCRRAVGWRRQDARKRAAAFLQLTSAYTPPACVPRQHRRHHQQEPEALTSQGRQIRR